MVDIDVAVCFDGKSVPQFHVRVAGETVAIFVTLEEALEYCELLIEKYKEIMTTDELSEEEFYELAEKLKEKQLALILKFTEQAKQQEKLRILFQREYQDEILKIFEECVRAVLANRPDDYAEPTS